MKVIKRDGREEEVSFDKIKNRIIAIAKKLDLLRVDPIRISQETISGLYDRVTTEELDFFAARKCANHIIEDPQYNKLAAGLTVSNLHKTTSADFLEVTKRLYENKDLLGEQMPLVTEQYYQTVCDNIDALQSALDYERDFLFDFFAIKTLERAYLIRIKTYNDQDDQRMRKNNIKNEATMRKLYGRIIERPQHLIMRVAIGIHGADIERAIETYNLMSLKYFTHASPTLYNAGSGRPQMSSCFVKDTEVLTMNAGVKSIQDVAIDDEVVTHTGKIKKVKQLHKNYLDNRTIYRLDVANTKTVYVTENHRFLTIQNGRKEWRRIDQLNVGDYLMVPNYSEDGVTSDLIGSYHIDEPFAKFLGFFLGKLSNGGETEKMSMEMYPDGFNVADLDIVKNVLINGQLFNLMTHWSKALVVSFMDGLSIENELDDLDKDVTNSLYHICRLHGLDLRSPTDSANTIILDSDRFVRVEKLEKTNMKPEYVYTLGVEDDHSYNVEGLICENCYLLDMGDSIEGIFGTITECAFISKWSGGIGVHLQDIRAKDSLIRGTNGCSDGIKPLIQVLDKVARYVNQGGRRNGAIATYIEPWHSDIFDFLQLKTNTGKEDDKAKDIHLALWIPDLFMKRVAEDGIWSLMCPDECPGLTDSFGDEFEKLYEKYEQEKRFKRQVRAIEVWNHILESQIETGEPYMCYKDHVNRKSNQQNIGIIKSSNLCSEIMQVSDEKHIAVCNLASICLPRFVEKAGDGTLYFNYDKLVEIASVITRNLDRVIDVNYYPVDKCRDSNMSTRPMGIGVQGLADVFYMMRIPFDSEDARDVNKRIFETIYYGALRTSCELAKEHGPYEMFANSPFSQGILQFHMWGLSEDELLMGFDWETLINDIKKYGTRNSLLTSVMPTASTSQIMGNYECIEQPNTNLYLRTTLAGEFIRTNEYLVEELIERNLWTQEIRDEFRYDRGSVQQIAEIPDDIKNRYKTAFELKMKPNIQLSIDRAPFIDQSQSLNIFMDPPNSDLLTKAHFYGWKNKLKTGMYYLRTSTATSAIRFGLNAATINKILRKRNIEYGVNDLIDDEVEINPRRVNEIDMNRRSTYEPCDMCSG